MLLKHMQGAVEHKQWRDAFTQAFLDPSISEPDSACTVFNEAGARPRSGAAPDRQARMPVTQILLESLYQAMDIPEHTWQMLLQVYPRLQVHI